jgi:hypothetical protein
MTFRLWIENRWWEFKDTVVLYHGTSSAFADKIKSEGLVPPGEKLEVYAEKVAKQVFPDGQVPLEYWKKILSSIYNAREDSHHQVANVIYLLSSLGEASGYAKAYYELGGEIAYDVYKWAWIYCNELKLPKPLKPLAGSKPIVVEVLVPSQWMKTYGDIRKKKEQLDHWYDPKDKGFNNYEDYMEKQSDFEVRIANPIPPEMIKKIHTI